MTLGYNDGDGIQALDQQQDADRLRYAVFEGCLVSPGTDPLTVECEAGRASRDDDAFDVAAQDNVALDTPDPNYPRRDTVYLDANMSLSVATGTPEPPVPDGDTRFQTRRPAPPVVPNAVVLAEVWVPAAADDIVAEDVRDRRVMADTLGSTVGFDVLQDYGRFQMVHLNTFNVGGDQKQAEVNLTISDYTDKSINKILLQCEHLSVHSADGTGDHTFAVQYNGYTDSSGYVNYKMDGTYTENGHAILTKQAPNNRPFLGRVWLHVDQTFSMIPQGGVLTYTPLDHTYSHTAAFNPNGGSPATIDSLRFFTPDADEIRMRRTTVLGFSEGVND